MTTHEKTPTDRSEKQGGEQSEERGREQSREHQQPTRTHLSAAGLRARGWTPAMIRQLLGDPDLLRPHPHFRPAPQTRLYGIERVEAAEHSEEFRGASAAAARRSAAARAAALRRRREVLTRIAAEPIEVPRLAPDRLTALAVEHRSRRNEERALWRRGHVAVPATVERAEPGALDRWKVDYLRHRLTRCDEILDELYGRTGRAAAEELLRRRIYAAIAQAYPDLARECERRLRERGYGSSPG
ncbi:hypothetical protein SAMN04487981_107211 [Streptomyces sp. cf386]|uniref:hypothetical protein n=1 Tax=Streptomyces sp. cf386 TaxID=1761904 RepID=UPI0008919CA1|nr:hypothetical protein [Streptomyces sp. cf386]SDN89894.1 hypothetical protein SAMN04487981_107211 [Streptomyces sp. cf386]